MWDNVALRQYKGFYIREGELEHYDKWIVNESGYADLELELNDVVLDLGGYIGTFAKVAAPRVSRLIVLEPDPRNIPVLWANLEGLHNVEVFEAAVIGEHREEGPIQFRLSRSPISGSLFNRATVPIMVQGIRFSTLLRRYRPTVLKIDIEGSEWDLDFTNLPNYVRRIGIELHGTRKYWYEVLMPELLRVFDEQGFEQVAVKKHSWGKRYWDITLAR
jgi:FkbM family methyltransferase